MLATVWCVALAAPLPAQTAQTGLEGLDRPWYADVSRYGKWISLATAAGLVTAAALYHRDASDAESALTAFCAPDPAECQLVGAGGDQRYANAQAEALFHEFSRLERASRRLLVGGQLAIVATGGLFLIDLLSRNARPDNIPYTPLEVFSTPGRLGFNFRF